MAAQTKYRPSLTANQIAYILRLAKQDYADMANSESLDIIAILQPFMAKIEVGAISASHTAAYSRTDRNKEFSVSNTVNSIPTEFSSKEEYWEYCYNLYSEATPNLTIAELQAAKEWMYLNDLMTPEEITEYEKLDITKNL